MDDSINPIIILILTQAMIFLGEIPNPISGSKEADLASAERYLSMLKVLNTKTAGNLTEQEDKLLTESLQNLTLVFQKRQEKGNVVEQ